jgi:hypothetical protein
MTQNTQYGTLTLKQLDQGVSTSWQPRMLRQAHLDALGALHHMMARGIERATIFRDDQDRGDLVVRLADLVKRGPVTVHGRFR